MKFRVWGCPAAFGTADAIRPEVEGSLSLPEPLVVNDLRVFFFDRTTDCLARYPDRTTECLARYPWRVIRYQQRLAWLRDAVEDAQLRRKGLPVKIRGGLVAAPDEEL